MSSVLFHEMQTGKPPSIYFVCAVLGLSAISMPAIGFGLQLVNGPLLSGGLLLISMAMLGLSALLLYSRMALTVDEHGVELDYRPFIKRRIFDLEISSAELVDHRFLTEYGGWGIRSRLLSHRNRAYIMSGHQGVMLNTIYGNQVLLGTDRGEELLEAIQSIL